VLDHDNVYWAEGAFVSRPGSVRMKPKAGGPTVTLEADNDPQGIAVDDVAIAWADNKAGRVMLLAK
jgi:hypothetical protein